MFPNSTQLGIIQDSLQTDLVTLAPELILCGGILLLLLARMMTRMHLGPLAMAITGVALAVACIQAMAIDDSTSGGEAFHGLVRVDAFACFLRCYLLLFTLLLLFLSRLTAIPDAEDSADFSTLILGATLGMLLMVSASHLLMVFLAVEMTSLPSYALSGFLKGRTKGSEAALKYVVYGSAASGFMLYGISLLAGRFGTGHLPTLANGYAGVLASGGFDLALAIGTLFTGVGLGFKLAAFPFHFWLPDVFEGAAAEVGAMLSVASKAAAVGLVARLLAVLQDTVSATVDPTYLPGTIGLALAVIAGLTATFGNLAAFGQTNMKRLLAYSTIAHAGYMLMALAVLTPQATAAVLYYLVAYLLMNMLAFSIVAMLRNKTGSEELASYQGLLQRSPVLAIVLALAVLSLLGLPPLAGFAGKFQVFAGVFAGGQEYARLGRPDLGLAFTILLGVGVLNTVISAGYYLRILRVMILDEPVTNNPQESTPAIHTNAVSVGYLIVLTAGLIGLGIIWDPLTRATQVAVNSLLQ